MTPEIGTQLISTLGVLTVLAWYMYYNVTVTIPNVIKVNAEADAIKTRVFADSMDKKDALFAATQKEIADNFSATLKEERAYRREEISSMKTWLKAEAEANCKYNRNGNV